MSLLSDLLAPPQNQTAASRFTTGSGLFYMASGAIFLLWPAAAQALFQEPPFVGQESVLFRIVGMMLVVIGWFYFFGGRSGSRAFIAATVVDRLVLVPVVLVTAAMNGVFPHILSTFAVLDPALAAIAWYLLSDRRSPSAG